MRTTTEEAPVTTEELEFKDVPIFEKDKPRKPAPGTKYVAVLKCSPTLEGKPELESSDGQRSQDEKEFPENIHELPGTATKDVPAAQPPTEQQTQDKGQDVQTDSVVDATDVKPTLQLVAAAQDVSTGDEQAVIPATAEKSKTEASDVIADDNHTKDETSVSVGDKLTAAEGSQPSKPAMVPSSDELMAAEELVKTASVVKESAKTETTHIADEPSKVEIASEDVAVIGSVVSTPVDKPKPESQVISLVSDDANVGADKVKGSSAISSAESDKSNPVSDDNKNIPLPAISTISEENDKVVVLTEEKPVPDKSGPADTDPVPVKSETSSDEVGKIVASVDVASETLASMPEKIIPVETISKDSDPIPEIPTIAEDKVTVLTDVKPVSEKGPAVDIILKDSDPVPEVSQFSEETGKVVSSLDVTSETLASVPEKSVPADTSESIKKDDFESEIESTNNVDVEEEKVKDFTGYKVYRVTVPTEEVLHRDFFNC